MSDQRKEVIVITGGSGCLAQHLIRELQLKWADRTKEIRVVDKKVFKKFLDYEERIPIVEFIADCSCEKELEPAFTGATLVFHMAARPFCYDMYSNNKAIWRDNFHGTETVVAAMVRCNVEFLVYTSDAMAWIEEDCQGQTELSIVTKPPKRHVLRTYGKSKYYAEKHVAASNGKTLTNGKTLKTIILSPAVIYGEGDNSFFPYILRVCKQYGYLLRVGEGVSIFPQVYAGNVAYAHVCGAEKLLQNWAEIGGEMFYIDDQITPYNLYDFLEPLLEAFDYQTSNWSVYWMIAYGGAWILEKFFDIFHMFGVVFPHNLPNAKTMLIAGGLYFTYNTTKSRLVLNYKPKYNLDEASSVTCAWFKKNWKN